MLVASLSFSINNNLITTLYYASTVLSIRDPPISQIGCSNSQFAFYLSPSAVALCTSPCGHSKSDIEVQFESCATYTWDAYLNFSCSNPANPPDKLCGMISSCKSQGTATFAFVLITGFLALITMIVFVLRKKSDTEFRRLLSIVLCLSTTLTCILSFTLFLPCMNQFNKDINASSFPLPAPITVSKTLGYPFAIAVVSFFVFIYMSFISYCIPVTSADSLLKHDHFAQTAGSGIATNKV